MIKFKQDGSKEKELNNKSEHLGNKPINAPMTSNHVSYVVHKWDQPISGMANVGNESNKKTQVKINIHSNPSQNIDKLKEI
jgi:hypothetical protein